MTSFLVMRFEGPLQSWGTRGKWDYRDSGEEPTKSGVIGLLGCALGYPVNSYKLEELEKKLKMGTRVEHPGKKIFDFHTIRGVLPTAEKKTKGKEESPATIVSSRVYLQDAAFLVVLEGEEGILEECSEALQKPKWPIYLGRKACIPTRPVFEGINSEFSSLEKVISTYPWEWEGKSLLKEKPEKLRCIVENSNGEAFRMDRFRSNPARMYSLRTVEIFDVPTPCS